VRAKAASCWAAGHSTQATVSLGVNFGWRKVEENGWCGNGSSITWNGGASFTSWRGAPYCWNDPANNWSWDVPFSWIHGGNAGTLGGSYIWGCASSPHIQAGLRINARGGFDHYDDF
jgi:hypothetical protein